MANKPQDVSLPKLSEYLGQSEGYISESRLKAYKDLAMNLVCKDPKSKEEIDFFMDYMENHVHAKIAQANVDRQVSTRSQDASTAALNSPHYSVPSIRLNELVIKPESFDGLKPPAYRWLEDFESASQANGWTDGQMVKYLPTFLVKSAHDWYVTRARSRINEFTTWAEARKIFLRNYIGGSEKAVAKQELFRTFQRESESISCFMPRLLRVLMTADPGLTESSKVEVVKDKLLPSYQEKLCLVTLKTLDDLNDACLKIESGIKAAKSAEDRLNHSRNSKSSFKTGKDNKIKSQEDKRRNDLQQKKKAKEVDSSITCNRCTRPGHLADKCYSTKKPDGTKLPPKAKERSKINMVETAEEAKPGEPKVTIIRNVGAIFVNKPQAVLSTSPIEDRLIRQNIKLNGHELSAMLDSGSGVSIISEKLSAEKGWKTSNLGQQLMAADGNPLNVIGSVQLETQVTIGSVTKIVESRWFVVKNLCINVLVGTDLMGWLDIELNIKSKAARFAKTKKCTGVRAKNDVVIPARSTSIVSAIVNTVGNIFIKPFSFPSGILVANSISPVEDSECKALVANLEAQPLLIPANLQLGLYEPIANEPEEPAIQVNATLQLDSSEEMVQVGDNLSEQQVSQLSRLIHENIDAFSVNGKIGVTDIVEHDIELIPNAKPVVEPLRRRAYAHREECNRQIRAMLEEGVLELSNSPWASAYVLVRKKSGEMRLCIDFRRLNDSTKKDSYPLPNVDECIETLAGKSFFSQLDLASGFWQIPLSKRAREMTAFRTEEGHFQFTRMPFGLCNAPASFQRMVNALFAGLKGIDLQVFIDDICLATVTWEEHISLLNRVFKLLISANLKLKSSKCVFGTSRVVFLGHEISVSGIRQEPYKLRAMLALPSPTNVAEVKRALGMFSYYRKFVPSFALIAEPLTRLTRKKEPFQWASEQEEAFRLILSKLGANATLAHFDHRKPTALKTDASLQGVAGILLQRQDEDWKVVSCCSRRLSQAEGNYGVTDLEGLAVVYAITKFRHYLLGKKFQLLTDHCALCALRTKMPNSPRLRRWAIILSEYDFQVVYTKGSLHEDVDCLSRAPIANEFDNLLEERVFQPLLEEKCSMVRPLNQEAWVELIEDDQECRPLILQANQGKGEYRTIDGILYSGERLFVPAPKRMELIKDAHDSEKAAHGGIRATLERLQDYFWPGLSKSVTDYIKSCDVCQRRKAERALPAGTMQCFEAYEPFDLVAIDCLGPLAASISGKMHVMVAIDTFSKFVDAKATRDVKGITFCKFMAEFVGHFGAPKRVLTDNATTFINQDSKELLAKLGIEHVKAVPHHSRSNAVVERVIQSLQEKLSLILSDSAASLDWERALPATVLALNSTYHKSTGYTPFQLVFGSRRAVNLPEMANSRTSHDIYTELLGRELEESRADAIGNTSNAQNASMPYFEEKHRIVDFSLGDLVLSRVMGRRAKLQCRYEGPYRVFGRANDVYKIESLDGKTKLTRHVKDLRLYLKRQQDVMGTSPDPAPSSGDKASTILMIFLNLFFLFGLLSSAQATIIFTRVPPVLWTDTKHYVSSGMVTFHFRFEAYSLCDKIKEFRVNNPQELENGLNLCHQIFMDSITNRISKFNSKQIPPPSNMVEKREIEKRMVAEFFTAAFISNCVSTLLDRMWPSPAVRELQERQKYLHIQEENMSKTMNATTLLSLATKEAVVMQAEQINHNLESINRALFTHPDLMVSTSFVVTKIQLTGMLLERIRVSTRTKHLDFNTLSVLLETEVLDRLEKDSVVPGSIRAGSPAPNILDLEFVGRFRLTDTEVYRVSTFRIWTNLTGIPALMEYTGPRFLISNSTNNCVKSITEPSNQWVNARCEENNYADHQLSSWHRIMSATDPYEQPAKTQVIESWPHAIVYCFTLNITFRGEADECPPYAFKISANERWSVSDGYIYSPSAVEILAAAKADPILTEIHTIHFRNHTEFINENHAIRKIVKLSKEVELLRSKEMLIGEVGSYGLSYSLSTYLLAGLILVGLTIFSMHGIYNHFRRVKQHHETLRSIHDGFNGPGSYDTLRLSKIARKLSTPVFTSEANSSQGQQVFFSKRSSEPQLEMHFKS